MVARLIHFNIFVQNQNHYSGARLLDYRSSTYLLSRRCFIHWRHQYNSILLRLLDNKEDNGRIILGADTLCPGSLE